MLINSVLRTELLGTNLTDFSVMRRVSVILKDERVSDQAPSLHFITYEMMFQSGLADELLVAVFNWTFKRRLNIVEDVNTQQMISHLELS